MAPSVAIIGAGFSGASLAINLHNLASRQLRIRLIECREQFGRGLAYSTQDSILRLNGPAGFLSAIEDAPDHFVDWLKSSPESRPFLRHDQPVAEQFVPRYLYGSYMEGLLDTLSRPSPSGAIVERIRSQALDLDHHDDRIRILLSSGEAVSADWIVLATGYPPPKNYFPEISHSRHVYNVWDWGMLREIPQDARILILGTGQTMIDVVVMITSRGHKGIIYAVSRRGLIAHPHAPINREYTLKPDELPSTLNALVKYVRREVSRFSKDSGDWRAVMNAFLPVNRLLWASLSLKERKRFFEHLAPYWYIHRTRMPSDVSEKIRGLRRSGQLQVIAGRVCSASQEGKTISVSVKRRSADAPSTINLHVDRVVNCTGPAMDFKSSEDPFIQNLIRRGIIQADPTGVGLNVTDDGAVIPKDGRVSNRIFALGPPCQGQLLESTVIREIRKQSLSLANIISSYMKLTEALS